MTGPESLHGSSVASADLPIRIVGGSPRERMETDDVFKVAGLRIESQISLPCLEPFRSEEQPPSGDLKNSRSGGDRDDRTSEASIEPYETTTTAWVGGRWREVVCRWSRTGAQLEGDGLPAVEISARGDRISVLSAARTEIGTESDPGAKVLREEILVGPALLLALALRGRFALHASALEVDRGVIALVGDSGAGKSTLARPLSGAGDFDDPSRPEISARRIADDILVVTRDRQDGLEAWPWYPQLKVDQPIEGAGPVIAERLPVIAIVVLAPVESRASNGVTVEDSSLAAQGPAERFVRESPTRAALALTRHTVASKIFDPVLLRRHLDFTTQVTARTPVYRLTYEHDLARLPALRRKLERFARDQGKSGLQEWPARSPLVFDS